MSPRIATALYGWMERFARDGIEWDWRSLYGACAASGVTGVETDPTPEKRAVLDELGLQASASYIGMPLTPPFAELDIEGRVLPIARRLAEAGGRVLVMNSDAADGAGTLPRAAADVARQGENLSRIAELVAPLGLRVALHNHADTYDVASADLASVIEHADAAVGLCIDTGWAMTAGHDPVAWARDHRERVLAVHLRDQRGDGIPTETLGEGEFDIEGFVRALGTYDGWLTLELWHPPTMTPRGSMRDAVRDAVELLHDLEV